MRPWGLDSPTPCLKIMLTVFSCYYQELTLGYLTNNTSVAQIQTPWVVWLFRAQHASGATCGTQS